MTSPATTIASATTASATANAANDTIATATAKRRDVSLDALRGLAMLIVVFNHSGFRLATIVDYIELSAFFIISGYLFNPVRGFGEFLRKKGREFLLPYIYFNLLYSIVLGLPDFVAQMPLWRQALWAVVFSANAPLWFFKALFWAFVCCYFLKWPGAFDSSRCKFVAALVTAAVGIGIGLLFPIGEKILAVGLLQGIQAVPLLLFGSILHDYRDTMGRVTALRQRWLLCGVALPGLCMLIWHGTISLNACDIGNVWVYYPYTIALFLGYLAIVKSLCNNALATQWVIAPLAYVGRHTLSIFCVHYIFARALRFAMPDDRWLVFVITMAVCLIIIRRPWWAKP